MYLKELAAHLRGVRWSGDSSLVAFCPAHDNSDTPAFSASIAPSGKILVYCFAGCTFEQVVAALGVAKQDLFPDGKNKSSHQKPSPITLAELATAKKFSIQFLEELGVADFPADKGKGVGIGYFREDETQAERLRRRTALRAKDGCDWIGPKEAGLIPYGLWKLVEAREQGRLVVVEGETDCWALWAHGWPALGLPGAMNVKILQADHLRGIDRLYIVREPDAAGSGFPAKVAARARSIGFQGEILTVAMAGAKDPCDLHIAGTFEEEWPKLIAVAVATEASPAQKHKGPGEIIDLVDPEPVHWLWNNYIPLGKLSDLQGDPGQGKSAVTASLVATVTTGRIWPNGDIGCKPAGAIMISGEDDITDTIRPRLEAAGADLRRVLAFTLRDDQLFELPRDLPLLEDTIKRMAARLVIIDPLDLFVSEEIDTNKNQSIRKLLARLAQLAAETMTAIMVVRHLNKDAKTLNPMYRGGGSIGMNAASRQVFMVGTAPDDDTLRVLLHVKGNNGPAPRPLGYRLESTALDNHPEITTVKVAWTGEVQYEGWQLLLEPARKSARKESNKKLQAVVDLMSEILKDGEEHPAEQVEEEIKKQLRVSHAYIWKAREALGVKARKKGYQGAWMWQLVVQ